MPVNPSQVQDFIPSEDELRQMKNEGITYNIRKHNDEMVKTVKRIKGLCTVSGIIREKIIDPSVLRIENCFIPPHDAKIIEDEFGVKIKEHKVILREQEMFCPGDPGIATEPIRERIKIDRIKDKRLWIKYLTERYIDKVQNFITEHSDLLYTKEEIAKEIGFLLVDKYDEAEWKVMFDNFITKLSMGKAKHFIGKDNDDKPMFEYYYGVKK